MLERHRRSSPWLHSRRGYDSTSVYLTQIQEFGPSLGLHLNMNKCEVFWPSGDQSFLGIPKQVRRIGEETGGVELLGSPV